MYQTHDLDISRHKELRFWGWRLWSLQNTFFIVITLILIPTALLVISSYWKIGFLVFSILKIVFSIALILDLIAIALFGVCLLFSKRISEMNRLEKGFLGIVLVWLFITSILRFLLIGSILFSPLAEMTFLDIYYDLLTEPWFLVFWAGSNSLLILILIADSRINQRKIRNGILEDHRSVFGLFSGFPVLILGVVYLFESFGVTSLFYGGSTFSYVSFSIVVSKIFIGPVLGRRAGKLEIDEIIASTLPSDFDTRKGPLLVNMKKTRYLKYTKKLRNIVVGTVIFLLVLPISPFFLTNLYKEPDINVTINRSYSDNEALGVLRHIEALPLENLVGINSEHIMTNRTLHTKLDLISNSTNVDIFYLFRPSSSYFSLYWEVDVENVNDLLLDTSVLQNYWVIDYWYDDSLYDAYFIYWNGGNSYHDLETFNSSELYAEWN